MAKLIEKSDVSDARIQGAPRRLAAVAAVRTLRKGRAIGRHSRAAEDPN
jgi:hypothetical protein